MREDFISLNHGVRNSSLGDAVYNSPKLPPPSDDFSHVMLNLEHRTEVKRIKSCGDVTVHDSDGESRGSPYPMSVSLPHESIVPRIKGRRTVGILIFKNVVVIGQLVECSAFSFGTEGHRFQSWTGN